MEKVEIKIAGPGGLGETLTLRKGLGLLALREKNKSIEFDCVKGDCGICIFKVRAGMESLSDPTKVEQDFLQAMHADEDERLACQCRVFGDLSIEVEDFSPD